jgi:hypothetical protein
MVSLYSSNTVDKKEVLHTVSNTGIYCSSDEVGAVTWCNTFSKISPSISVHFAACVTTWHVAHLSAS